MFQYSTVSPPPFFFKNYYYFIFSFSVWEKDVTFDLFGPQLAVFETNLDPQQVEHQLFVF